MAQLRIEHLTGNTYYIPSPTNIGIYVRDDQAYLIDSGNDKEAGRQILRLLKEQGWQLAGIINTHSNADHIGGNAFLQEKTGCRIYATRTEAAFIEVPLLEPAFLYGGFPNRDMRNKFLLARPARVTDIIAAEGEIGDTGLVAVPLPGHYFEMIGVRTPDGVLFIADSLFPEGVIAKYHLFYLLDLKSHLETLQRLRQLPAELFVPAHGVPTAELDRLIRVNEEKIQEIMECILSLCRTAVTEGELLERLCQAYGIELNATQYVLLSSTLRAYLTYLYEEGRLACSFAGGKMTWQLVV